MERDEALFRATLEVLKEQIRDSGKTQTQVAEEVGLHKTTLTKRLDAKGSYSNYSSLDSRLVFRILGAIGLPYSEFAQAVDARASELERKARSRRKAG